MSTGSPPPLFPAKCAARPGGITRKSRWNIRASVERIQNGEPHARSSAFAMPRGGCSPTSRRRTCGGNRVRLQRARDPGATYRLALGGSRRSRVIRMFQFGFHRQRWSFARRTVLPLLGQRVPDVKAARRIGSRRLALLHSTSVGTLGPCASLPRSPTAIESSHRRRQHQELPAGFLCRRTLGQPCPIWEGVIIHQARDAAPF